MRYLLLVIFVLNTSISFCQKPLEYNPLGERYAIVIGISKYQNPANNLQYAQKDAEDFSSALIQHGRFKAENIKLLLNKDATRENIRKNIEGWLKTRANENDLTVIFFSGHGSQIPDSDNDEIDGLDECLIPYDFDNNDYSSVITDDLFAYWVRNLKSNRILIIFDNCYSGGAAKQKGVSLSGVKGSIGQDNFSRDIAREVPRKGTSLLAASKANQVSFESSEFNNGIFTHFLINSISASSDNDFNKILTSSELFYSTRTSTLEYSKKTFNREQEPIFLNLTDEDLDVFYLPVDNLPSSNNKDISALIYKANQEQNFTRKLELYKEIYKSNPANESYNSELASLYEFNKDYENAIKHYKWILSQKDIRFGYFPPIEARIGSLYGKLGKFDLAIYYYDLALKKKQSNEFKLHNSIADIYLLMNDTLSAIQHLNKSISIQPLQKEPYLTLFYIHLQQNHLEVASKVISNSFLINSFDTETMYWHAVSQKFIYKNLAADSLMKSFEDRSGILKTISELESKSKIQYSINGKVLSIKESQLYNIQSAINKFPYYDELYRRYIEFVKENKLNNDIKEYKEKFSLYSKMNPDTLTIRTILE